MAITHEAFHTLTKHMSRSKTDANVVAQKPTNNRQCVFLEPKAMPRRMFQIEKNAQSINSKLIFPGIGNSNGLSKNHHVFTKALNSEIKKCSP